MKKYIFLPLILIFLSSCDKEKQTSRKIDGDWTLKAYKITFIDGVSEYAECSGKIKIIDSDFNDWNNSFNLNISYVFPSISGSQNKDGYMRIKEKGGYMDVMIVNTQGQETTTEDHRIMVLTSTDLQLEYYDSTGCLNNLTFRR